MQPCLRMARAESLGRIWSAAHAGAGLLVSRDEAHCLRALALATDDDVVSYLLLKKLQVARIVPAGALATDAVRMASFVEFSVNGAAARRAPLVHPSACLPAGAVSVTSLLGAGLVGMRAGQAILWPAEQGGFCELRVISVAAARPAGLRGKRPPEHRPPTRALALSH